MTEFLNDKSGALGHEFWDAFATLFQSRENDVAKMMSNPESLVAYLQTIKGYADVAGYLTDKQWFAIAAYVMENAQCVGTLDFIYDVFKLIFGESAEITFNVANPTAGVLNITIVYSAGPGEARITTTAQPRVTTTGDVRIVTYLNEEITMPNFLGALSKFIAGGVYTTVTLTAKTEEPNV